MNIRFFHARILTMREGEEIFEGELHVKENRITYVGPPLQKKESRSLWDEEIDCEGNLLMPGFKNAHSHSPMTFLRSYADDLPLQEWLQKSVFPMEAKLTDEAVRLFAKLGILEYLTSGITSNFDMYLDNRNHAKASLEWGYRTVLCGSVNDMVGSADWLYEQYQEIGSMGDLVSFQLGLHAEYTTSRKTIEQIARLADKIKKPVYLHLSETRSEVDECIGRYGVSPVRFLHQIGLFQYGGGGFHGVWLDEKDREILASDHVAVITCPGSNTKLASGIADLVSLQKAGILLAIGTDGPASNNALDMFREMYLTAVLQKIKHRDAAVMDAIEVLRMATVGGARVMGLKDCETLSKGQLADLIMIDMSQPNMQPENDIEKNLVYSGSKQNVKLTMVNGKILYRNGSFYLPEAAEDIYRQVNEMTKKIKESSVCR